MEDLLYRLTKKRNLSYVIELAGAFFTPPIFSTGFSAQPYSVSYTATQSDAGKYLQVLFCSVSSVNDSIFLDSASVTIICGSGDLTADMSGDCKVDFEDFAIFASEWLECSAGSGCI